MRCIGDLIETLWNVKAGIAENGIDGGAGFNRDIVECKVVARYVKRHVIYLI